MANDDNKYKWTYTGGSEKSLGIIIVNNNFADPDLNPRAGSDIDRANLQAMFTNLGLEPRVLLDKTTEDLKTELNKFSVAVNLACECLVLAISSHGGQDRQRNDYIWTKDGKIGVKDVLQYFSDKNCPSLKGKPKIVFITVCRGGQMDTGFKIQTQGSSNLDPDEDTVTGDCTRTATPSPCLKNFLVMYSTPPGYYSFRNTENGSWLFKHLKDEVLKRKDGDSLTDILTCVTLRLSQRVPESQDPEKNAILFKKRQTPVTYSMLTKDLYFPLSLSSNE